MFVSLTLATLAVLMGSRFSYKLKETEVLKDNTLPPDDLSETTSIPFCDKEIDAYINLCKSLTVSKSINDFNYRVRQAYKVLLILRILGNEKNCNKGIEKTVEKLYIRFKTALSNEKFANEMPELNHQEVLKKFEKLKEYVSLLLSDRDISSLRTYYLSDLYKENNNNNSNTEHTLKFDEVLSRIISINKKCNSEESESVNYCYYDLLNDLSKIYNELSYINNKKGLISNINEFQERIIDDLADAVLKNTKFYFCYGLTAPTLSHDIKKQIIHYIHHDQPKLNEGDSLDKLIEIMESNYFANREIRNYYYFLVLCSRYRNALETNWKEGHIFKNIPNGDMKAFNTEAKKQLFKSIGKFHFNCLPPESNDVIWTHILSTDPENQGENKFKKNA